MRLPVSMRAVAMIVRLPPCSMLRAAPKKRLGLCRALESTPPDSILPLVGHGLVVGAGEAGDRVEEYDDVFPVLDESLGLVEHHLGDLDMAGGLLVESRGDDLGLDRFSPCP